MHDSTIQGTWTQQIHTVSKQREVTGAGGRPVRSCCLKDKEFVFELVREGLETGGAYKNTNSLHDIK